jgi:predicted GNAT family acetyltransferase
MEIRREQKGSKGMFYVGEPDQPQAEMTYTMPSDSKMIIEHTEVSDALRGKNVGYQMVATAVNYARENGIKIIPLCPFAASVFRKRSEYGDVLVNKIA